MRKLTEEWADQLQTGKLKRYEAWLALTTTIWKTLEYPLNALTVSKKECKYIMAPAIKLGLNGAAICKNLPKALCHGPISHQRLGLPHVYTLQGIARLTNLVLNHSHINTITGFLHRANLEQIIIEVGLGTTTLEYSHKRYGKLGTFCLIERTWKFLSEYNIHLSHDITVALQREGDALIMKKMVENNVSLTELQAINRCRLYLQVTTISDITNGDGIRVSDNALQGIYDHHRPHYYQWPYQPSPPTSCWTIWRRSLRRCLHDKKLVLNHRLGKWTDNHDWMWHFSPTEERLYQRQHQGWKVWIPHS
jgi:hypothetical protein